MPYRTLMKKSRGEDVRLLQNQLEQLGFRPGPVDGVFGFLCERAVRSFQRTKGLPSDGIVGQRTWTALLANDRGGVKALEINLMPVSNYGGRGKAVLHLMENELLVTCWAMPMSGALGKNNSSGKYFEYFTLWLANTEKNKSKKISPLYLDGLEYKINTKKISEIGDYNLLLVTIEDKAEATEPGGIPLLIGSL